MSVSIEFYNENDIGELLQSVKSVEHNDETFISILSGYDRVVPETGSSFLDYSLLKENKRLYQKTRTQRKIVRWDV